MASTRFEPEIMVINKTHLLLQCGTAITSVLGNNG